MRTYFWLPLIVAASILAGCGGKISNLDAKGSAGGKLVYPISAQEADSALAQAMMATFPDSQVVSVALPKKGYMVTMRFMIDRHEITASATPATGRDAQGATVSGYAFEVVHSGTLPNGPDQAAALFKAINDRAAVIRPPVPAAS